MNTRNWLIVLSGIFALATLPLGCGSDDDNGGGGGTPTGGTYEIYAGFTVVPEFTDTVAEDYYFVATVERMNSSDPSAMTAVVTVDGTTIPLLTGESTADEAVFRSDAILYAPDSTYAVQISLGDNSSSSTLATPDYETEVTLTAPAEGSTFTPGDALPLVWSYTGQQPGRVVLEVVGVSQTEDESLYEMTYNGSTTSASIPGSETTTWAAYDEIYIGIGAGETQSWSGSLAYQGSFAFVLLSFDEVTIYPEGGTTTWTVTVEAARGSIATTDTTAITVSIADAQGDPPAEGTSVALTVSPSGAGSIAPATVTTNALGEASAVFTAGASSGTATVMAIAASLDNASGSESIGITGGGTGEPGTYVLTAGFLLAAEGPSPLFTASVTRTDPDDPSAMEATVTVNGTSVPLFAGSDDSTALFQTTAIGYTPNTTYAIDFAMDTKTAGVTFVAPDYTCQVDLTNPVTGDEFTPGVDIDATWTLSGTNPPTIRFIAAGDIAGATTPWFEAVELPGTARNYTVNTSDWTTYDAAIVVVSVDEYYEITGELADDNSTAYVNLTSDMAFLEPEGGGGNYYIDLSATKAVLQPNGTDTTLVSARVEDFTGDPCPDGSTVTFSIESGGGTLSSTTATTTDGLAQVVYTAPSEASQVVVRAEAFDDFDEVYLSITEVGSDYVMVIGFPDLTGPLAPNGTTAMVVQLKTLTGQACPDGTEITLRSETLSGATDYVTFGQTTLTTTAGEAETTVTAGSSVPLGGFVTIYAETQAVAYIGGQTFLPIGQ